MRKLLPAILVCLFFNIQAQTPQEFLQPDVWLRADQLSEESNYWEDKSGNEFHAVPSDSFELSINELINFNGAISFDGSENKLNIPFDLSQASQLTILTVYNSKGTVDERGVWGTTINPGQDVFLSTQKITGPQSIAKYSEGNMNLPVVNTSAQYWGKAGDGVPGASLYLGSTTDEISDLNTFSGNIAEFIVFDRLVGGIELQILQSYLSIKYGSTLQYSDYISSTGDVVWDYLVNEEYSFAIAGIGRDDGFDLYQKQSSNVEEPEFLTIGAEQIVESNTENSSTFNNGNFLVWGMNDKEAVLELSDSAIYPYTYPVLERKWLMDATGNRASDIPTEIQFNVKDLIGESTICYLVIDRSGTGDFASQNIEYILTENISEEGVATFEDIQWDTDNSGSDVFSISFGMDNGVECTHPICHNDASGSIQLQVMGGTGPYLFVLINDAQSYKKEWTGESRFQNIENLEPGNYKLIITDNSSNIAQNTVTINNPGEFSTGLEPEYTLEMGESLVLDAGKYISEREATFEWESDNGFYSTSDEIMVTQPGEYTITITNKSGCVATETLLVKALDNIFYHYQVYPNPSNGDYKLDISLAGQSPVKVRIFSTQGAFISEETSDGASSYTFRGCLDNSGLYFVEIETSFGTEIFKLIVNGD